jgi:DivIVA domain-containing protein
VSHPSPMTRQQVRQPAVRRIPHSADQIRNRCQQFRESGITRRGYAKEEVDRFLGLVADDVDQLVRDNSTLREEVWRLKDFIRANGQATDRPTGDHYVADAAVDLLSRAQRDADAVVAQAHDQARTIVGDAAAHADALLADARQQANTAAAAYRARAGAAYSSEGEELQRKIAWISAFVKVLIGVRAQLPVVEDQLATIVVALQSEVESLRRLQVPAPATPVNGNGQLGVLR